MSWRRFLCRREHISSSSEQKNFFRSESSVIYVTASRVTKLNIYRFSDINSRQQQDYDDQKTISLPSLSTRWLAIFYLLPFPPSPPKKVFQVAPNAHKDCCSIWLERKNACFLNGSFPTSFDFHLYRTVKAIFKKIAADYNNFRSHWFREKYIPLYSWKRTLKHAYSILTINQQWPRCSNAGNATLQFRL